MRNHWNQLSDALTRAGIVNRLTTKTYWGGTYYRPIEKVGYNIDVFAGNTLIQISDSWWRKNTNKWLGWKVTAVNRKTDFDIRNAQLVKNVDELVAVVAQMIEEASA